jgi:hypothetical protein
MAHRITDPRVIAARKWEIKRRYQRDTKVGKRTRSMAAIRLAELTRWIEDTHGAGAELDAEQRSEQIARIFVHHFVTLADGNRRAAQWLATYTPWISLRDREYLITQANRCPLKWSADKLGWHLHLSDEQRSRLKITTIGAIGISKEMRLARRNAAKRERERARRAANRANRVSTI